MLCHCAGLLFANLLLHSSQARQPAADINDHESCAILGLHPGGFASNINQILLSMVLLPYSRFYVDDSDLKYRCSADGSWDDTFQGSVRAKGEESKARNCTAISVFDGVYKMNDLFAKKALEGSTGHAALFEKKLTALQELWHLPEQLKSITERHVAFVKSLPGPLTAVHVRSGQFAVLNSCPQLYVQLLSWPYDVMPCHACNMRVLLLHRQVSAGPADCTSCKSWSVSIAAPWPHLHTQLPCMSCLCTATSLSGLRTVIHAR